MNKLYHLISLLFFINITSCTIEKKSDSNNPHTALKSGLEIFSERCTSCHGADGKLGFGGAKDLSISNKSLNDVISQVMNGKGAMAPYKNILTPEEIQAVSEYTMTLRK